MGGQPAVRVRTVPSAARSIAGAARARRTMRAVLLLQLGANGIGAAIMVTYALVLYPVEVDDQSIVGLNLVVFGLYVLITVLIAVPINRALLDAAIGWIGDARPPTDAERRETLRQPKIQTASALLGWLGAAIVFGLLNDDRGRVSIGIAAAGLLTCTLLYQLLERIFRPLFAMALEGTAPSAHRREIRPRIMLAWLIGSAVPLLLIGLAPVTLPADQLPDLLGRITAIALAFLVAGGLVMRATAEAVSRPVEQVRNAMGRVAEGDLSVHVAVDHVGEIGRLQSGLNEMVDGLRERRRLNELFGRQVGLDVARQALERDPELGGEEREITALFIDIVGFTAFAEHHTPAEIVAHLNEVFSVIVEVIDTEGGWVNKFEGDAALCIFGTPADQPDHARRALRAAARLPFAVAALPGGPRVGVGAATGLAIAGHVGTPARYEYTVIGDAVNVASRLCELAKHDPSGVLVADSTMQAALHTQSTSSQTADLSTDHESLQIDPAWTPAGELALRGRASSTLVHAIRIDHSDGAESTSSASSQ